MALPEVPDWTQLVQLMGQYAGTPTLVALDEFGNIVAVLKGEYAGVLKTLATDSQGRLLAVVTDPEDVFGVARGMGLTGLAAVLSPWGRFDHRGSVYHLDSFEHGLSGCAPLPVGADASITLTTEETKFGGLAAKMTAGSDSADVTSIGFYSPLPPLCKVGVEASCRVNAWVLSLRVVIDWFDGETLHEGQLQYLPVDDKWQYLDSDYDWVDLLTGERLVEFAHVFHLMKLVVDPETDKYVRALISGQEVDMSTYSSYSIADSTAPMLKVFLYLQSQAGYNGVCILDNLIITIDEPA